MQTDIELTDAQRSHMQALIDECDFVGMSFYRPVSVTPRVSDFVRGVDYFMEEFRDHGLRVPMTMPMHFSEVGIGGGHEDDAAASEPAKAVETPWDGSGESAHQPMARGGDAATSPPVPQCPTSVSGSTTGPLASFGGLFLEHWLLGSPRDSASGVRRPGYQP